MLALFFLDPRVLRENPVGVILLAVVVTGVVMMVLEMWQGKKTILPIRNTKHALL